MNYDNIPDELKKLNQWVCVKADSKVPMKAWEYENASSTSPDTWSDFKTALDAYSQGYYDNLGFVFADNGYVGIDIDCGRDEYDLLSSVASDIIGKCQSYTEVSRSGRGFHILLRGTLPFKGKNNLNGIEIYKASRYFIMTGKVLLYHGIIENQKAIDYVISEYFDTTPKSPSERVCDSKRIYCPKWENIVSEGKIRVRPTYPEITSGSRNLSLTSLAGAMHTTGYPKMEIYEELKRVNEAACKPMLDNNELQSICNSISRYAR